MASAWAVHAVQCSIALNPSRTITISIAPPTLHSTTSVPYMIATFLSLQDQRPVWCQCTTGWKRSIQSMARQHSYSRNITNMPESCIQMIPQWVLALFQTILRRMLGGLRLKVKTFICLFQGSVGVGDTENEVVLPCKLSKLPLGNHKFKVQFGQWCTYNEQTLVRPCGVIFARATFFGAEAVLNVLVSQLISISWPHSLKIGQAFVKNAFSVPGAHKLEHLIYDTNCDAKQQAWLDPYFNNIGVCWHIPFPQQA
jgi:hypothetical protein